MDREAGHRGVVGLADLAVARAGVAIRGRVAERRLQRGAVVLGAAEDGVIDIVVGDPVQLGHGEVAGDRFPSPQLGVAGGGQAVDAAVVHFEDVPVLFEGDVPGVGVRRRAVGGGAVERRPGRPLRRELAAEVRREPGRRPCVAADVDDVGVGRVGGERRVQVRLLPRVDVRGERTHRGPRLPGVRRPEDAGQHRAVGHRGVDDGVGRGLRVGADGQPDPPRLRQVAELRILRRLVGWCV